MFRVQGLGLRVLGVRVRPDERTLPQKALRGGISRSFLEPFCGHLSPKNDQVSNELTLRYPHEEPAWMLSERLECYRFVGLRVEGFGFWGRGWGAGCRVQGAGCRGAGLRAQGGGLKHQGLGLRA